MPSSEKGDVWSMIVKQLKRRDGFDGRYVDAIEEIIHPLVKMLDDDAAIKAYRETEVGMADGADDGELLADCVRMDVEVEILEAVTRLAYGNPKHNAGRREATSSSLNSLASHSLSVAV